MNNTARSREDETRNGHRHTKRNPRWSSQGSFHTAHLKKKSTFTMGDSVLHSDGTFRV